MIEYINELDKFNEFIKEGTVLIDFFATWCGPCKMLSPVIEQVEREHPELKVVKVDVDEAPQIAVKYGIQAIPTLFLLKDGKVIEIMEIVKNTRGKEGKRIFIKILKKGEDLTE